MKSGSEAGAISSAPSSITTIDDVLLDITSSNTEEPFYLLDVADILWKHKNWLLGMPRVRPFYAVKCNPCPLVLELLAALGTGFDCASKAEIDTILALNVDPSDIIYANPCKTKSYIKHAAASGVDLMTFDNEFELHKIAKLFPDSRLVIRIKVDDSHSICRFSSKFGAELEQVLPLLTLAKALCLEVVGVSFHVGSGCESAKSFADAISNARYVYDVARAVGYDLTIVDIGGGFPGTTDVDITFSEIASVVNEALDQHFPDDLGDISIIAEPGRYYVASAFTLNTMIVAKRLAKTEAGLKAMYYLNDGVYGSFNCTIFDHRVVDPVPLVKPDSDEALVTTLWGPTCDSLDLIKSDVLLPELHIGDWIVFREMGAYTVAAASNFNGFMLPPIKYHLTGFAVETMRSLPGWPRIAKIIDVDEGADSMDAKEALETRLPGLIIPVH